jgi:uncharacterized membrane protein YcaP (DUF421 family)
MKNSDWIIRKSQEWLQEEIDSRGLKNEHELYLATLHGVTHGNKDIK